MITPDPECSGRVASFDDRFAGSASSYARFRPTYPSALYEFLGGAAPSRALVWDAGTGSGQAAVGLAEHFDQVVATDPSAAQLQRATPHPRISYRCEPAESASLPDGSADLITAAAAIHWFDRDLFYSEARRVLRPNGVIALWAYHLPKVTPEVDAVIEDYSLRVLAADWPAGSELVLARYSTLSFPFAQLAAPTFAIELVWSLEELAGFIGSWSAAIAFRERCGVDPLKEVMPRLQDTFGTSEKRLVRCPLFMKVGRLPARLNLAQAG